VTAPTFEDWHALVTLKARYCRFLDIKAWSEWARLFTEDLVLDTTPAGGARIDGRDAAVAYVRASLDAAITTHHVHNPEIVVVGDTATAIWAMQDRNIWPTGRQLLGFGHYHERYRRVGQDWLIAETILMRLHVDFGATVPGP
jgi:SnoaL-like domain